ncbi:hypothetical protein JW758_01435 [Candidatus Peregrinibacteria bacterium]|nr:hypothetical protein [Candidatus Peregrinibacteria bacterium]
MIILLLIIVGGAFYMNSWLKETNALRAEAELRIEKAKKFDVLSVNLEREFGNCQSIIAKNEINPKWEINELEYCKKYVRWYEMYN